MFVPDVPLVNPFSWQGGKKSVGKNSGGSAPYTGITPIGLDEKYRAASYPSYGFTNTWSIAEGVDEPRLMPLVVFADFLDGCNLPIGTKPDADVNGIPVGARYAFGIAPLVGPANLADWTHAAECPVDPTIGICLPDFDCVPEHIFFK